MREQGRADCGLGHAVEWPLSFFALREHRASLGDIAAERARLRQGSAIRSRQLRRLRRDYAEEAMARSLADQRRLEFARWLVTTGRLTDQIA